MHEILFRGKTTMTGKWVEGTGILNDGRNTWIVKNKPNTAVKFGEEYFIVDPETIGQYTGLYDRTKWEQLTKEEQSDWLKNHTADEWKGRKIFEGDVVRVTHKGSSYVARIEWDKGSFWVSNPDVQIPDMLANIKPNYIEVINNPELLEKEENGTGSITMDVREKLVELMDIIIQPGQKTLGDIADHLITHGVTVQEWISVKDRLPEADGTKVIVTNGVCSWEDYLGVNIWVVQHNSLLKKHKKPVTHWQPMPQPPKVGE